GTEGGSVDISCKYPDGYLYTPKYLCRAPCTSSDVLIKCEKADRVVSKGKYSLVNNVSGRCFSVTIKHLTLQDSGVYYCGLSKWGFDKLTKVKLTVSTVLICATLKSKAESKFTGTEGGSVDISCKYSDGYQYTPMYFCRDPCAYSDLLIKCKKADTFVSKGRYSAINTVSGRRFSVAIKNLTLQDSGVYYCGVDTWGFDKLTKVKLTVSKGK
ncbi:polymeric immunoglobulin receptor-like, partial [Silurus meridionalis]